MKKLLSLILSTLLLAGANATAATDAINLVEGQNYKTVSPPQSTTAEGKIEVLEIFSYACPHCHAFDPLLNQWVANKPPDVEFQRMPAIFRESWVIPAKAYYTAQALGITNKFHPAIFKALHEEKRKFPSEAALAEFFGELGVSEEDFSKAFHSFAVDGQVRQAVSKGQAYGIAGVPALVVNGKYQVSGGMANSYPELLKILDALVDKVRQEDATKQ